ncbi:hypothetical protein MBELCI_3583 [Limimaricola cinnabarinus LL-001]|uniref:Uncharacterized protein n=1 Tax=Limimaricola cinnabarinus LL-001 TaxID=1337093 RepID=U2YQ42_9RHOB|nr:hypothetical protein MBELCI_3583 [Limimaricola cinnabarinus LL-001]
MAETACIQRIARERRYHRFFQIVDKVVEEIQAHQWVDTGKPKRRLRGEQLQMLRASVETLIRDSVAVVYQRKRKGESSIHLHRNWYSTPASPADLAHSIHVQRAYQGMLELGYLEQTRKGVYDRQGRKDGSTRSRLTRYRATDHLIGKFTPEEQEVLPVIVPPSMPYAPIRIQVKTEDGRREASLAPETGEVLLMQWHLERINRVLTSRWYDLLIPDAELAELQARLADDPDGGKPLALDRRTLHRVFNDADLTTGGRFYGGWWQNVPKKYRRHLLVNGKRMVEIDYSNLHPVILYAEAGVKPPEDCYRCIFDAGTEAKGGDDLRSMVKAAFNAMLNAGKELRQAPKGINPGRFDMTWRQVSDAILTAHEPIAHHFYTGVGKRLQRKDSDVAERVMLAFIDSGIPILPIHDSFLVHEGHRDLLNERMQAALTAICGVVTKLKPVEPDLDQILAEQAAEQEMDSEGFGAETTQDLGEILATQEGHDKRLDAFLALPSADENSD